jgi:hypothetical protein
MMELIEKCNTEQNGINFFLENERRLNIEKEFWEELIAYSSFDTAGAA